MLADTRSAGSQTRVSTHIFRVVVRGHFHDLSAPARDRLLAELDDHDIFKARYSAAGSLTYERNLVAFSFRYEVRERDDAAADAEARAIEASLAKASASLAELGVEHRHLRATATDMASMWET